MNIFCSVCAQPIPHEEAIKGAKTHKENVAGQLCRKLYRTWMNAQKKAARINPETQAMIRLIKSRKTTLEELRSVLPAIRRGRKPRTQAQNASGKFIPHCGTTSLDRSKSCQRSLSG